MHHYSIENFYHSFEKKNENISIKKKEMPFISQGLLKRIFNIFWSIFNQGDINHVAGDINYIAILLRKKKTILTILDFYSLKRLNGLKSIFTIFFGYGYQFIGVQKLLQFLSK